MLLSKRKVIFYIFLALADAISLLLNVDFMYLVALNLWIVSMIYAIDQLKNRSLYFIFLISFFTFLMGGHFCYEYLGMEIKYYFGDEYYFHSNLCLAISLLFILMGVFFSEHAVFRKKTSAENIRNNMTAVREDSYELCQDVVIRKSSLYLFLGTYIFWIYTIVDKISFVLANSYKAYYTEYESSAPFVVKAIAAMTPYFFYLFLATLPSKKECRFPILLYGLYAILSLLTGRRSNFMIAVLFILLYVIFRHYRNKEEEWIKKKYVILGLMCIPLLAIFLQARSFLREGNAVNQSWKELFFGFFQQQGFSSSIIRLEKYYESSLRSDAFYSLFGIVKTFRTNSIIKLIFNPQYDFSYLHNSVEFATRGNSLSNALSYKVLWSYLSGTGLGTCYIAELYHDFGYIGIFIGNFIYGSIMFIINKIWNQPYKHTAWGIAIGFSMVESFIKAPRWNFDIIFQYFLDLGMWMAFLAVFIMTALLRMRHK